MEKNAKIGRFFERNGCPTLQKTQFNYNNRMYCTVDFMLTKAITKYCKSTYWLLVFTKNVALLNWQHFEDKAVALWSFSVSPFS